MDWQALLYVVGAGFLAWLAFRMVRNNPSAFSKKNLGKSLYTVGLLTLLMIGIIALCVIILRN